MLLALLAHTAAVGLDDGRQTYHGRAGQLVARPPRLDVAVEIDGRLDEPAWAEAAILTGFSQFTPADGVPAADSTEVLVWYSPTAIHFGIRAFEAHGRPSATLADRDRIDANDHVQIFLSTFDDARQASVFMVNPFGVQADGALVETGRVSGNGFNSAVATRETPDLSPDFVWQSKGRLTEYGYEVEIRIPFKSLRYQAAERQSWGINVLRRVQHSGYEDTWTPARRASASFLAQSGRLEGLTDLRRGLVLDLNPVLTQRAVGERGTRGWRYDGESPELGGNVRWGVTNNLTLNGTVNPDFSQVESDAGQFAFDPRQALFFAERRPFFLEGIEQFDTPNRLIYTRRVVEPVAAVKLTGKAAGTDIAFLSAVDGSAVSATGEDHPVVNVLRAQRDIGRSSRIGLAYTDRVDGANYNRVADVDGRLLFGGVYTAQFQLAASRTRAGGTTTTAPLWEARFNRNGRNFGWRTVITGIHEDFRAQSGFISRPGIVHANIDPRYTWYVPPGHFVESFTFDLALDGTWQYEKFVNGRGIQDRKAHFNANARLRGGWQVGASLLVESFGYDSALYAGYAVELPTAGGLDTVPFTGTPRLPNLDYVLSLRTPDFQTFSGSAFVLWGRDENFFEWASGRILWVDLALAWRPTEKLRVNGTYTLNQVRRWSDRSLVSIQKVPRVKVEYQLSRPLFVRLIGEYASNEQDALRDDTRTGAPILVLDEAAGTYVRAGAQRDNRLRGDVLLSYQPSPGTVAFLGYGSALHEPTPGGLRGLRRESDAFFLKLSYLFRM